MAKEMGSYAPSLPILTGYSRGGMSLLQAPQACYPAPAPHLLTREHPLTTDHLYAANPSFFNNLTYIQPPPQPPTPHQLSTPPTYSSSYHLNNSQQQPYPISHPIDFPSSSPYTHQHLVTCDLSLCKCLFPASSPRSRSPASTPFGPIWAMASSQSRSY